MIHRRTCVYLALLFFGMHISLTAVHISLDTTSLVTHIKSFIKDPRTVGAIAPCSNAVGVEITRWLRYRQDERPLRILEVGAGGGSITKHIIELMHADDQLDVVEIDPTCIQQLEKEFGTTENVALHCLSITDWSPKYQYDVVISTLPFNNFDVSLLKEITNKFQELVRPGGVLSYVEYILGAEAKVAFAWGSRRRNNKKRKKFIHAFRDRHLVETVSIFKNVPPINVHHLRMPEGTSSEN